MVALPALLRTLGRSLAIHSIGPSDAERFVGGLSVELRFDVRRFDRDLRRAGAELERAAARALTRATFDVRDALLVEAEVFDLTSRGRTLLAGSKSWKVTGARADSLFSTIEARPATAGIIFPHARGAVLGAEHETIAVEGQRAIPVRGLRGASGRVPKRLEPAQLRRRGGRGFVARGLVLARTGRRRFPIRALFSLARTVRIPRIFRFEETVRDTAERALPEKLRREFEKVRLTR